MSDIEERIRRLEDHVDSLRDDLRVLRTLVEHDHSSALNKVRYITEKVLHQLCADHEIGWGKAHPTLERMIGPLIAKDVIPRNVGIHVRTIQTNASPGSHYQEDALTSTHVLIAQVALLDFLEWYAKEPGIGEPRSMPAAMPERTPGGAKWIALAVGAVVVGLVGGALGVSRLGGGTSGDTGSSAVPGDLGANDAMPDGTMPSDAMPSDAMSSEAASDPPGDELAADGYAIGGELGLTDAAMIWRRLRRVNRHRGITFLGTEGTYALALPRDMSAEQAAEVAALVELEAHPRPRADGDHLTPRAARVTTALNLRAGPGPEHASVRILPPHAVVIAIEGRVDGRPSRLGEEGFLYTVATAADAGWSAGRFVTPEPRCLPPPDAFLAEAPAGRAGVLRRDLTYSRVDLLAPSGSGGGFVLLARDLEIGRSHVGVFFERGTCHLERQFFSTVDGIVEGVHVVETERAAGESLLLTQSHPSLRVGPDGRETWHAYRLTSTDPVWSVDLATHADLPYGRRTTMVSGVRRAGAVRGYWPVEVRLRGGRGVDYYRWNGHTLELDPAVSRAAP